MIGIRKDGRKIKTLPALFRIIPCIMRERNDAEVFFKQDVNIKGMDEYIDKKEQEGIHISYMDIIYASLVRLISQRPELNRFIMNGRIYARNNIVISLAIKKSMSDEGEETIVKIPFTGEETIFEIKEKLNSAIISNKQVTTKNKMDKMAETLNKIPTGLLKTVVNVFKFLDKRNMLPNKILELSPFHASCFLTNVGSLGLDYIYHHIYNFGTVGLFVSMGRKKKSYIFEDDETKEEKCITLGFVGDERLCDGFYFSSSFKLISKYLRRPELLEEKAIFVEDIK